METVRSPATLDRPHDTVLDMPEVPVPAAPEATVAGRKCVRCDGANCVGNCGDTTRGDTTRRTEGFGFSGRSVSQSEAVKEKDADKKELKEEVREMLDRQWAHGMAANALRSLDHPEVAQQNQFVIIVTLKGSTEPFQVAPRDPDSRPKFGTLEEHIKAAKDSLSQMNTLYVEDEFNNKMAELEQEYRSLDASSAAVLEEGGTHSAWKDLVKNLKSESRSFTANFNGMKVVFQDAVPAAAATTTEEEDESVSAKEKRKKTPHTHAHRHSHSSTESLSAHSLASSCTDGYEEDDESTDSEADEPEDVYDTPSPEIAGASHEATSSPPMFLNPKNFTVNPPPARKRRERFHYEPHETH